jgi:hypothetical protein
MAHRHRLVLWPAGLRPQVTVALDGAATGRFDDYDSLIMPYVTGRGYDDQVAPAFWPVPLDERFPDPAEFGGPTGPRYGRLLASYGKSVRDHFVSRGWYKRGVILLPTGPQPLTMDIARSRAAARQVREPTRPLRTVGRWSPNDPAAYGVRGARWEDLAGFVDIWAPDCRLADPRLVDEDTDLWLRPTAAPFLGSAEVSAGALDVLTWTWAAWRMRARGLWCFGDWTLGEAAPREGRDAKEPNGWFYNGAAFDAEGVLPSVRLKLLRRAQQDYAYLDLVRRFEDRALADRFASTALYAAGTQAQGDSLLDGELDGWSRDEGLWQAARHLMGRTLDAIVSAPLGQRPAGLTALRVAQRMLFRRREAVSIRPEAARLGRVRDRLGTRWRIDLPVRIYNRTPAPVAGRLRPGKLPAGWAALTRSADVVALQPGEDIRLTLSLATEPFPASLDGKLEVPVQFQVRGGSTIEASVPLAAIRCGRFLTGGPPAIDGNLNDWPTLAANTAGRFEVIGARTVPKVFIPDGRTATRQTLVTACADAEALYLAFACRGQDPATLQTPSRNFAEYDGLIPWGQDAVVAVIDPSAGDGPPQPCRCLLVLPSGVIQATHGVPSNPPTAETRPWLADARVATMKLAREGVWWVEMRIPFAALGGAPRGGDVWRINFARVLGRLGEVSTWSGPARYPAARSGMGNLVFEAEPASP